MRSSGRKRAPGAAIAARFLPLLGVLTACSYSSHSGAQPRGGSGGAAPDQESSTFQKPTAGFTANAGTPALPTNAGSSADSDSPAPPESESGEVSCGATICANPLEGAASFFGVNFSVCCLDPATATCGRTTEEGACVANPEGDPECPDLDESGYVQGCCLPEGECGLSAPLANGQGNESCGAYAFFTSFVAGAWTILPNTPPACDNGADAGH